MALSRRKVDRIAGLVFLGLCLVVFTMYGLVLWPMMRGAFTSARDIQVSHPETAVDEGRALIVDRGNNPRNYRPFTAPESLPDSLRIPGLRYAMVHRDHVDLVVARNPDESVGARIWSAQHRPHRDEPTKYPDIQFFRYTNDLPESPENIP